jgi:Uma2 family endonuclease
MAAMAEQTESVVISTITGQIVATGVSEEEYLEQYAAHYHEWVKGVVVKMTPVSYRHDLCTDYLRDVLKAYFALNPIGRVVGAPFVMRLDAVDTVREPDLQVILNTNSGQLADTAMIGPADICIEVVSPESVARDYGEKFEEYEKAGVREYWIIDPARRSCLFYRLQETKLYATIQPDADSSYHTPLLPNLALHVPRFWQDELPDFFAIGEMVKMMFGE